MKDSIVIAIDGPSASGKGTCGRYVAAKLGFLFVDTGAMYRALTWYCLENRIDLASAPPVVAAVRSWPARLEVSEGAVRLLIEGRDPGKHLRTDAVSAAVARISPIPAVRIWMVRTQRECLGYGDMVMDGRDVGTHIFPETPFKFFLTASDTVRAQRRRAEGSAEDTSDRDRRDVVRAFAPLEPARDAIVVDNSHADPAVTGEFILAHYRSRRELAGW